MWHSTASKDKLLLKHISWSLNINITIVGFKRSRDFQKCKLHSVCYLPYFIFQNTMVKILRSSKYISVILCYFKRKYYILHNHYLNVIHPYLINTNCQDNCLLFQDKTVTSQHIMDILNHKNPNLPFNVQLYSTYSFVFDHFVKQIQNHNIGQYLSAQNTKTTLHLFITPELTSNNFKFSILTSLSHDFSMNNEKNLFSFNHIQEGKKLFQNNIEIEDGLNQEYCICDHNSTRRIFLPPAHSFKSLGKIFNIKQE